MSLKQNLLTRIHRRLARSQIALLVSEKLRNQCDQVIANSFHDGTDPASNGEYWALERLGSQIRYFVDIGANVGRWTTRVRAIAPESRGLAIEPSASAFSVLSRSLATETTVETLNIAASDAPGEAVFFDTGNASETASLVRSAVCRGPATRVPVDTLDRLLSARAVEGVDFLKIDAEGSDFRVLSGAVGLLREQRVRVLQFEYNASWRFAGSTLAYCLDYLDGLNYRTWLLRSHGLTDLPAAHWGEYFGYSNYISIGAVHLPDLAGVLGLPAAVSPARHGPIGGGTSSQTP